MTETEWQVLENLLKVYQKRRGRPMRLSLRAVVEAIFYVLRNGCIWADLPKDFPNYNSVYYHYRKWSREGLWEAMNEALRRQARQQQGRHPEASAAIIDSQSVKTTEAGGARGFDVGKPVKGRKRHVIVDTFGYIIEAVVHAADIQDRDGAKLVFNKLSPAARSRLLKVWADGGYAGALVTWVREQLGCLLDIVRRDPGVEGFVVLPKPWIVERSFAWLGRFRRLSKDYERSTLQSETLIYLASIRSLL